MSGKGEGEGESGLACETDEAEEAETSEHEGVYRIFSYSPGVIRGVREQDGTSTDLNSCADDEVSVSGVTQPEDASEPIRLEISNFKKREGRWLSIDESE